MFAGIDSEGAIVGAATHLDNGIAITEGMTYQGFVFRKAPNGVTENELLEQYVYNDGFVNIGPRPTMQHIKTKNGWKNAFPVYAIVDSNGVIEQTLQMMARNDEIQDGYEINGCVYREAPHDINAGDIAERYVYKNGFVDLGPKPGPFYIKDAVNEKWTVDIDALKRDRLAKVEQWFQNAGLEPVEYDGDLFDADAIARERISGMIARLTRGDGLPVGWLGWRDYDNAMHWTEDNAENVLNELRGLATEIENREQQLIIQSWTLKAQIQNGNEQQLLEFSIP